MARKTQVVLEDDLTGGPADATVRFGLDGVTYEIDLNENNAEHLRTSLNDYVEHARRASSRARRSRRSASNRMRSAEIRAWARRSGIQINERGRIPVEVVEKYEAAH